jgi:aspartate dehydrogenase
MAGGHMKVHRIGLIGYGAMGRKVTSLLNDPELRVGAILDTQCAESLVPSDVSLHRTLQSFLDWKPELVIECASHVAVSETVPSLLEHGIPVVVMSVGALSNSGIRDRIQASAKMGGARVTLAPGAIGGIDALKAARLAGLESVVYTGRKPPVAWKETPAEQAFALDQLKTPTVIYEGDAAQAAQLYPKNANVTATVALAGVGFEKTKVTLIADPTISSNVHELEARGAFGVLNLRLANNPFPDNPKTSMLSALSAAQTVKDLLGP